MRASSRIVMVNKGAIAMAKRNSSISDCCKWKKCFERVLRLPNAISVIFICHLMPCASPTTRIYRIIMKVVPAAPRLHIYFHLIFIAMPTNQRLSLLLLQPLTRYNSQWLQRASRLCLTQKRKYRAIAGVDMEWLNGIVDAHAVQIHSAAHMENRRVPL